MGAFFFFFLLSASGFLCLLHTLAKSCWAASAGRPPPPGEAEVGSVVLERKGTFFLGGGDSGSSFNQRNLFVEIKDCWDQRQESDP